MTLGNKLQRLRKDKSMSQEKLAEELGVTRQAVSKWELDAALPDTANIIALSRLFDVSADYLLKDEIEEPKTTVIEKEKMPGRVTWKTVTGTVVSSLGALGIFALFVVSRFVEVMVPVRVEEQHGTIITTWDSGHTDIDFRLFLEQNKLYELLYMLIAMVVIGVIFICWDKHIGPWLKKMGKWWAV